MSNERTQQPRSPEDQFLARLGSVAPIASDTEQAHLAAALTAVREGGTTPVTAGRPTQRSAPRWRNPRMALSKLAAIVAGLSLPMKAAAASTVAVAAIGGGVAVTSAPENPPADTPAYEALEKAAENAGFDELPARGEPSRDEEVDATVETDDVDAQDEHGIDGPTQADDAKAKEDGRTFGEETSATASGGKSTEARERAAEAAADHRRDAEADDAAAEQRRDAEARQEAQARADAGRQQEAAGDATTSDDDADDDLSDDEDDTEDGGAAGADASSAGRAKAGAASGR